MLNLTQQITRNNLGFKQNLKQNLKKNFKNKIHILLDKQNNNNNLKHKSVLDKLNINRSKRKKRTMVIDVNDRPLEWNLQFQDYIKDIESITHRDMPMAQKKLIKTALTTKKYYKLTPQKSKQNRSSFSRQRKQIVEEWEKNTHQKWPQYDKPIFSKKGKIIREPGQRYDMHHIIECSWGGPATWWNMHPAKFPSEHQLGVHRKGGLCEKIFNKE